MSPAPPPAESSSVTLPGVEPQDLQETDFQRARASLTQLLEWHRSYSLPLQADLQAQRDLFLALVNKLDQGVIQIATFGLVSRGKSAVLNALFGEPIFPTGPLNGVTQWPRSARWIPDSAGSFKVQFELIDTPGLDEIDGEAQAQIATTIARQADLILFVIAGELTTTEAEALRDLRTAQKPLLLVLNKMDLFPDFTQPLVHPLLREQPLQPLLSAEDVIMTAAEPMPTQVRVEWPDGRITEEWQASPPQVEQLQQRLLALLNQEGRSLLALNTLFQAQDAVIDSAQTVMDAQQPQAQTLTWKLSSIKAIVIALTPFLALDLIGAVVADLILIRGLAKLYNLPITRHQAGKLGQKLLLSGGLLMLGELGSSLFGGLNQLIEGVGMTSAMGGILSQATLAAYGSLVVGQSAKNYLKQGCTWGPLGPSTLIQTILNHLQPGTVLYRLQEELVQRLEPCQEPGLPEN